MRNFYELNSEFLIDPKIYLEEWTKKLDILSPVGEFSKPKVQSLGSLTQNLWSQFNTGRDEVNPLIKNKNYMESASDIRAYSASFLLPNIERVFSLLIKDENSTCLKNHFLTEKEELVIADFGSGPLSASVGFMCVLEYLLQMSTELYPPKKIKIFAIERSEKIYQYGLELLQKSLLNKIPVIIERITSPEKIPDNIHIALCANIFNEIPVKHRLGNLNILYSKMNLNGAILIVEPGQEIHAKALGKLRDDFLLTAEQCEIISPCAHQKPCPLSNATTRADWCWFRMGWNPPEALKEIEKYSKIDHHFLNFSYLFLTKTHSRVSEPYFARIVSDKLNVNLTKKAALDYFLHNMEQGEKEELLYSAEHGNLLKVLLCSQDGSLKSSLFDEMDEERFKRGMRYIQKNAFKMIFSERN